MYEPRAAAARVARNETLRRVSEAGVATGAAIGAGIGAAIGAESGASVSTAVPMYSRRFGEPAPASATRLREAAVVIAALVPSADVLRVAASWSATAPAT